MNVKYCVLVGMTGAALLAAACSQDGIEDGPGGSAGTGNAPATTGGSTSNGTGGTGTAGTGTEGSGATSATGATGGTESGSGAAPATGGAPVGGTGGSGESGSGAGGGTAGTGSATGGAVGTGGAGSGGTGGAGAGGAATGGAGGSSGGTGGGTGGEVTPATIVPTLDGYLWVAPCKSKEAETLDCKVDLSICTTENSKKVFAERGYFQRTQHKVGGNPNTKYTIDFEVRGVMGGKYYTGGPTGKPRTATYSETANNDGWYEGGLPTDSKWNTWEVHVSPAVAGAPTASATSTSENVYYLNAFAQASGFDGKHETFPFAYSAKFAVMGGSTITLVMHDSNCQAQQNCGQTVNGQTNCTSPRKVSLDGMSPQPVNMPNPYVQADNNTTPQWLYWDVKSVTQ